MHIQEGEHLKPRRRAKEELYGASEKETEEVGKESKGHRKWNEMIHERKEVQEEQPEQRRREGGGKKEEPTARPKERK